MVKVLSVAEKPAVAKRLAAILGRGAAQSVRLARRCATPLRTRLT